MMKTNVQVKDEPIEVQVNKLFRLYGYQSSSKTSRTKTLVNQDQEPSTCAWCQKLGIRSFTIRTDNGDSKTLCSEVCFNQYRRASFKKNKGSESDVDRTTSPIVSTMKTKVELSPEKKKKEHQLIESNRRKIFLSHQPSTSTNSKTKINEISSKCPPSPSSKRHRSSSPPISNGKILQLDQTSITPSNLPVSFTWQPSLLLPSNIPWPAPIDINRFQYPFLPPPLPPPPPPPPAAALPSPPASSSSNLFTTLTKGSSSNYTCILPTFLPLPIPIPIPLCFPVHLPCSKCSVEVNHQQCQTLSETTSSPKRTRRISL